MPMNFFEEHLLPAFELRWPAIQSHRFNTQLADGTLPSPVFDFYLQQDLLYLKDYAKALEHIVKTLKDQYHIEDAVKFQSILLGMIEYETLLRQKMRPSFTLFANPAPEKITVIQDYTTHLLDSAKNNAPPAAIASILACFYIYQRLGETLPSQHNHTYSDWIATYKDPAFLNDTQTMITIFNKHCSSISDSSAEDIKCIFLRSVEHELAFAEAVFNPPPPSQSLTRK